MTRAGAAGSRRQWLLRLPVSAARGWTLPESHLLPDAVVAFVDGELTDGARQRAAAHIGGCPSCAREVTAQRQARTAVHDACAPSVPAALLASLRSIPEHAELPPGPDNLAVSEDGQIVTAQRLTGQARSGQSQPGQSQPGEPQPGQSQPGGTIFGPTPLGRSAPPGQRAPLGARYGVGFGGLLRGKR